MAKPKKPRARRTTSPSSTKRREKIEPGPRNRAAIAKAIEAYQSRPVRVSIDWDRNAQGELMAGSPHSDEVGHVLQLTAAFGSMSSANLSAQLGRLEWATRDRFEERGGSNTTLNAALAMVEAVAPTDELEASLAVQMAGCHALAMEMLGRAKTTERSDHIELYGNMAVKLQRTFTAQIEALARMRGKGQQTVRVEHVTVQPGAQAIVGDVHHHRGTGGGGQSKNEEPPYETGEAAPVAQASPALPSPHPQGNGVPIPGDAERPVSAPRRTVTRRPRKSECA